MILWLEWKSWQVFNPNIESVYRVFNMNMYISLIFQRELSFAVENGELELITCIFTSIKVSIGKTIYCSEIT
ncbi:hypothetical protein D1872_274230 [compost metagenome]